MKHIMMGVARRLFSTGALLAAMTVGTAFGQPLIVQAPFGEGGTWNIYQVGYDPGQNTGAARTTWIDALEQSQDMTMEGVAGTLASVRSAQENAFLHALASRDNDGQIWIGLTDREGLAPQVTNNGELAPQESNNLADKLTQGWAWTTGEPFDFQAWGGGEPNDAGGEDAAHIRGDGLWNDNKGGFGPDDPTTPDLQPGTSTDETGGPTDYKFITEFNTMSPTPFPNIRMPQVLPSTQLGGPLGQNGSFGVVEYRNINDDGNTFAYNSIYRVVSTVERIQSGAATADATEGQIATFDVTDPDTNANGGPSVTTAPHAFLTDTAGDDDDIITVAHGRVRVTEGGEYTFQVRSDDGFALRFPGKEWITTGGNGRVDAMDPETLIFSAGTGDANTRGVINLPAGDHDVEFVHWERGGGAYYEITSAKGNIETEGSARWLALGDNSVLDPVTVRPPVTLDGPVVVGNLNNIADLDLEFNYYELQDALASDSLDAISTDVEQLILDDHNTALGCPFNEYPQFHDSATVDQFPNTTGADLNNFSTLIVGALTVDDGDDVEGEELVVSFHVDSDDRSMFRIVGKSFDGVTAQETWDIEGDEVMWGQVDTCNTNFSGVITLTEGSYDFEAVHVENGGDAGLQILAALGDVTLGEVGASDWISITTSTAVNLPGNIGLALVEQTAGPLGDYNGNGVLDAGDLDLQAAEIGGTNPAFDLTGDGQVTYEDRLTWVRDLKGTWIGDANMDGEFNSSDFVQVFTFGKFETNEAATWEQGDWNGDQVFSSSDFVVAFQDGGYENGPRAAVSAVPEPSSVALLVLGSLAGLGVVRRRK